MLRLILILLAAPYTLGPILIRFMFKFRAYSKYIPIEPYELPAEARKYFESNAPSLASQGFHAAAYLLHEGAVANTTSYVGLWLNPARGQSAATIAIISTGGISPKYYLGYETVIVPHGEKVETDNYHADAGIFADVPGRYRCRVPGVTPDELYQIHVNCEARILCADATRYVPSDAAAINELIQAVVRSMRQQVRSGLFYETNTAGLFRPTWYGATMMVLRLLPPLKQIRMRRARRNGRRDQEEARRAPAPFPQNVSVTEQSPFEAELDAARLTYV
jgi:hypothetical protein